MTSRPFGHIAGNPAGTEFSGREFSHTLVEHGIWVTDRGVWYTSTAHDRQSLDAVVERFEDAISASKGPSA